MRTKRPMAAYVCGVNWGGGGGLGVPLKPVFK